MSDADLSQSTDTTATEQTRLARDLAPGDWIIRDGQARQVLHVTPYGQGSMPAVGILIDGPELLKRADGEAIPLATPEEVELTRELTRRTQAAEGLRALGDLIRTQAVAVPGEVRVDIRLDEADVRTAAELLGLRLREQTGQVWVVWEYPPDGRVCPAVSAHIHARCGGTQ